LAGISPATILQKIQLLIAASLLSDLEIICLALSSKLFREGTYPAELLGGVSGLLCIILALPGVSKLSAHFFKKHINCMYLYSHQQCIQQQVLFVNGWLAALQFFRQKI
jgi:hypothetical protein